jgi:hypothetical protein
VSVKPSLQTGSYALSSGNRPGQVAMAPQRRY